MAARALTATELAAIAGVTKQTMSAHLSKLLGASLVRAGAVRLVSSPREPALRKARVCYDHLAGEAGVAAHEALLRIGAFDLSGGAQRLSEAGAGWFKNLGIDTQPAALQRRTFCRPCMDWSERRHHLAGSLGAALLSRLYERGWAARQGNSLTAQPSRIRSAHLPR
jgi:DNA-binding transcriptional ArsR family regulator